MADHHVESQQEEKERHRRRRKGKRKSTHPRKEDTISDNTGTNASTDHKQTQSNKTVRAKDSGYYSRVSSRPRTATKSEVSRPGASVRQSVRRSTHDSSRPGTSHSQKPRAAETRPAVKRRQSTRTMRTARTNHTTRTARTNQREHVESTGCFGFFSEIKRLWNSGSLNKVEEKQRYREYSTRPSVRGRSVVSRRPTEISGQSTHPLVTHRNSIHPAKPTYEQYATQGFKSTAPSLSHSSADIAPSELQQPTASPEQNAAAYSPNPSHDDLYNAAGYAANVVEKSSSSPNYTSLSRTYATPNIGNQNEGLPRTYTASNTGNQLYGEQQPIPYAGPSHAVPAQSSSYYEPGVAVSSYQLPPGYAEDNVWEDRNAGRVYDYSASNNNHPEQSMPISNLGQFAVPIEEDASVNSSETSLDLSPQEASSKHNKPSQHRGKRKHRKSHQTSQEINNSRPPEIDTSAWSNFSNMRDEHGRNLGLTVWTRQVEYAREHAEKWNEIETKRNELNREQQAEGISQAWEAVWAKRAHRPNNWVDRYFSFRPSSFN